jgi:hypothetical protein
MQPQAEWAIAHAERDALEPHHDEHENAVSMNEKRNCPMNNKHVFADLEAYNRIHEGHFDLPKLEFRQSIEAGVLAQVATADDAHHWLWIEVLERTLYGYRGIVDFAPPPDAGCPVSTGDIADFSARHVHDIYVRQAKEPGAAYEDFLADARKLQISKYWDPVLRLEYEAVDNLMPADMRGADGAARLAEYLSRNPVCGSCEARGIKTDAAVAIQALPDGGDENLMALCHDDAYMLAARAKGWEVRGVDAQGMPRDPYHPWNRGRP